MFGDANVCFTCKEWHVWTDSCFSGMTAHSCAFKSTELSKIEEAGAPRREARKKHHLFNLIVDVGANLREVHAKQASPHQLTPVSNRAPAFGSCPELSA